MKKPGEFLLQKQKHKNKQKLFDNIKIAMSKPNHEFWIDGCFVTTTNKDLYEYCYYTNAYVILETKRGFALAFLITKDCPRAHLVSKRKIPVQKNIPRSCYNHEDYSVTFVGLSMIKPKIYVKKVYNPISNSTWNYEEIIKNDSLENLPNLFEV